MKRRKAREFALQILFQLDIRKEKPTATLLKRFWTEFDPDDEVRAFTEEIVTGTYKHQRTINAKILACAKNWTLERMAVIDRNVLRMAVYEILYRSDIPPSVTINEAISLSRSLGATSPGHLSTAFSTVLPARPARWTRRTFADRQGAPEWF